MSNLRRILMVGLVLLAGLALSEHVQARPDETGRSVSDAIGDACDGGPGSADCQAAPAQEGGLSAEERLATKFAPVVYLKEQEEDCDGDGEAYEPAPVDIVLDNPAVTLTRDAPGRPVEAEGPVASDLFGRGEDFFLDFPGDPTIPRCTYEQDYKALMDGRASVAYAHIQTEDGFPGLALQYWFFYYFNDWNNTHEGDWEMIQLAFDADTVEEALQQEPARVAYAQHSGGETADWDDDKVSKEDGRPVVYVASGSHASQYDPGIYLGVGEEGTGFGCDDASEPHRRVAVEALFVPESVSGADDQYAWLGFEGRWGEKQGGHFNGPTGPNVKDKWQRPFTWEEDLRKSSVKVPGGETLGPNAVGAFCDVVGFSSTLLSVFRRWPLIVGGSAVLLTFAFFGTVVRGAVTARRRFPLPEGASPVPVRRRRYFGQMLRAAGSLYQQNLATFLSIALVFVPLGFIAIGVQAVIVNNPPVATILGLMDRSAAAEAAVALAIGGLPAAAQYIIVNSAIIVALREIDATGSSSFRSAYLGVWNHFRALVGGRLRAIGHIALFAVTVIGIPWAIKRTVRWYFVEQAVLLGGAGAKESLSASAEVVNGSWWRAFGITFVLGAIGALTGPIIAVALMLFLSAPLIFVNGVSSVIFTAMIPFVSTAVTLLYFDLKARKEP